MADVKVSLTLHPTFFRVLRTRVTINLHEESFDAAIENLKQAMEYAPSEAERQSLQDELDIAEQLAEESRQKQKDYYKILGMCAILLAKPVSHAQYGQRCRAPLLPARYKKSV